MRRTHPVVYFAMTVGAILTMPDVAEAYVGPGAGLTVIGAAIAFIAAIVLAIFGFVWYPIKRLLRARVKRHAHTSDADDPAN